MRKYQPSSTYKILFDKIIGELLSQICGANINYCVRNEEIPYEIGEKFDEYKSLASNNMSAKRLDRHKLASCICGAIIKAKPLTGFNGATIVKNANEILALHAGLNVIKYYMMHDLASKLDASPQQKSTIIMHLKEHYDMQFPSLDENVCDTQAYEMNLLNALYWTHKQCDIVKQECFRYDIWAYAKIFYHLELYNKEYLQDAFNKAMDKYNIKGSIAK